MIPLPVTCSLILANDVDLLMVWLMLCRFVSLMGVATSPRSTTTTPYRTTEAFIVCGISDVTWREDNKPPAYKWQKMFLVNTPSCPKLCKVFVC